MKTFGDFAAVDGVSLQVPQGTFFSILGPSGCGKTTLLRMVAGFGAPSSGDILIKGASVLDTPPNKRPVNMVFQHLALFPMMTVAENIGYGLRRRKLPREDIRRRVDAVLARIGMSDAGPRRIDQLSGGQKQRVAIARCMVLEPTVLLLDEPLGSLDLKLREHMKIELKALQNQFGTTFVYITHDQSEALVMSDQVAVMNAGRFEQVGSPQELYYQPRTGFVAGFVGDSHYWRCRVESLFAGRLACTTLGGLALSCVTGAGALEKGGMVDVFVRPEAIMIGLPGTLPPAEPGFNVSSGRLETLLFNGAASRAMVRLPDGDLVAVALPPAATLQGLVEGAEVDLRFAADQALAFPAAAPAKGAVA